MMGNGAQAEVRRGRGDSRRGQEKAKGHTANTSNPQEQARPERKVKMSVCVCPKCGHTIPRIKGQRCSNCSKCGTSMVRG